MLNTPFLLSFALAPHVFSAPSVALGDRKQTNKKQVSVAQTATSAVGALRQGCSDSHSHFGVFALLQSQGGEFQVRAVQLLHRVFRRHAVQLTHDQLVQVVGIREPSH